jgi:hypothetical protein
MATIRRIVETCKPKYKAHSGTETHLFSGIIALLSLERREAYDRVCFNGSNRLTKVSLFLREGFSELGAAKVTPLCSDGIINETPLGHAT